MKHKKRANIAIIGGGLAGLMAAAMLGRAGRDLVCIDPYGAYPVGLRCEKPEQGRIDMLRTMGPAGP